MESTSEQELTKLLRELSSVQDDLLALLAAKQSRLSRADFDGIETQRDQEAALVARLEQCHVKRNELLKRVTNEGRPANSLRNLSLTLPRNERRQISDRLDEAEAKGRLLRHHSLANWVLAQRALLHLTQLLEIMATGGSICPTYEEGASSPAAGALINEAV